MQLITYLSAAAATVTTASAFTFHRDPAPLLNKECDFSKPHARIVNRCDYPVHIWSILKAVGCQDDEMVTLQKGESYAENYVRASETRDKTGVSIKISRTQQCKGNDITQLEYFLDDTHEDDRFRMNYLDVSYVDCFGDEADCPTKKEGYYLAAGDSVARATKATTDNSWCPVLSCSDPISCAKLSYILPDDIATKTCDLDSSMTFYMCGSEAPDGDDEIPSDVTPPQEDEPESSTSESSTEGPSSTVQPVFSSVEAYKADAPAITHMPEIKDEPLPKVKTQVVYVTEYAYVNAKRHDHAHAHARRHQAFHA